MPVERCHIEKRHALDFRRAFYSNSKCICTVTNSIYEPSTQLIVPSMGVATIGAGRHRTEWNEMSLCNVAVPYRALFSGTELYCIE